MHIVRLLLLTLTFGALSIATAHQPPVTVDRLVSIERQKALGLDQLTPEQRAGIVRLLQETYQSDVLKGQEDRSGNRSQTPGRGRAAPTASVIETQVDGEFNSMDGKAKPSSNP